MDVVESVPGEGGTVCCHWKTNTDFRLVDVAVVHAAEGPTPDSQYEHSSLPATVKKIFNLKDDFLTARDAWAGTFEHVLKHRKSPRTDCPSRATIYIFSK